MAATKARPATDEPVKRTATKTPAKKTAARPQIGRGGKVCQRFGPREAGHQDRSAAKAESGDRHEDPHRGQAREGGHCCQVAPPRGAKATADAPATRGRAKKATAPEPGAVDEDLTDEIEGDDDLEAEPGEDLEVDEADLDLEDLEVGDDEARRGGRRRRDAADERRRTPQPSRGEEAARRRPRTTRSPNRPRRTRPPATSSGTKRSPRRCGRPARTPSSPRRPTRCAPTSSRSARSRCSTPRKRSSSPSASRPVCTPRS